MQGHHHHRLHHHHHLQQQLAALLSAALPQPPAVAGDGGDAISSSSSAAAASSSLAAPEAPGERSDDAVRVAAIDSLQCAVLYPPNALLLSHSAPFLSQGLSQLLNDKSYAVRRAAAITYGSLCAILSSTPLGSSGVQGHPLTLADHFVAWSLPLLGDIGIASGSAELALESVRQFLNVGDANSLERFVLPILKACQELLEDERTSLSLLHQLLGVLTLISLKFGHCFQSHFADIVDLLLGWAFMPDLSESDRTIIMDSFLRFQKHWVNDIQFSLRLLSKFLGDIDVLIQDVSLEIDSQLARLHALFSCFLTVLQVTASGLMEMNLHDEIKEPLASLTPRLLRCITLFGGRFGSSRLDGGSWRCLVLLAEILNESFSEFYPVAVEILFQSLLGTPSSQVNALVKTNLQLLSLQKLALLPSSVKTILDFHSPLSQLRLYPNHLVVASSAATYLFFLQHGSNAIVSQAITSVLEEMELLKAMLGNINGYYADPDKLPRNVVTDESGPGSTKGYSKLELLSLMKFDLKVLLYSVSQGAAENLEDVVVDMHRYERSVRIVSFILEKLDPFEPSINGCLELQVNIVKALHVLSEIEFASKLIILKTSVQKVSVNLDGEYEGNFVAKKNLLTEYQMRYQLSIIRALSPSSPVSVIHEALEWMNTFGWMAISVDRDSDFTSSFCKTRGDATVSSNLLFAILDAAYVMESKVRSHVASVMEVLLQARLIDPLHLYSVSEVSLDKLGDPDLSVKDAFTRLLSIVLPLTIYSHGLPEGEFLPTTTPDKFYLNWKKVLALKQFPRKLHSHQLVSIISYVSQRSKLPLSSFQRLIFSCRGKKEFLPSKLETVEEPGVTVMWNEAEESVLEDICSVSNLAAVWWLIHEAARHCIALRLRTNLGGPTQTFAAIERMLLDIPNVLILDAEHGDSKYMVSSGAHLLPMRLLLDFVEALKKNVYNAYEGSFVLPSSTRQSSLFFRANKKVCEEWFSRICEPMMNAGLALHCYDAAVQYCASKLQDLQTLVASTFKDKARATVAENLQIRSRLAEDVCKVLRHASLALCRNYEPEALSGLQKWVATQFSALFKDDKQHAPGIAANFGHFSWMTGLIYQAEGQYEKAAAYYAHLLQSEAALSSMGSDGVQFVIARIIECYASISDWKSLENWLVELQGLRAMHAGKSYSGALTASGNEMNAVHALSRYDDGDFQAAWAFLDLTPKSSCEITLDPKVALERSEQMLLRSMLHRSGDTRKMGEQLEKAKLMLDEALSGLPLDGLSRAASCAIQLHCIAAFEEGNRSSNQEDAKSSQPLLGSLHQVLCSPISKFCLDCGPWIKIFRVYGSLLPNSLQTLLLSQKLLVMARKQSNFMLADRMSQYLREHSLTSAESMHAEFLDLNFQYEDILLKYTKGKLEEALMDMWSFVRDNILSTATISSGAVSFLKAKACLKLSTWLRQDSSDLNFKSILLKVHDDFNSNSESILSVRSSLSTSDGTLHSNTNYNEILEEIVGTARKVSCQLCPMMGKAWLLYASWCFEQAKGSPPVGGAVLQTSSLSSVLLSELSPDRFKLTEGEMFKVEGLIKKICSTDIVNILPNATEGEVKFVHVHEDEAFVCSLVQQAIYVMQAGAGLPGFESCDGEDPSTAIYSQLQALFLHTKVGMSCDISPLINELVTIWWALRKRRVSLFGHAANGYFQYLVYSAKFPACTYDVLKEKTRNCTLRAMLYILHIVVNYGYELRETLEHGFSTVPLLPWQELIPQLFARLSSHPRQTVRKLLEALLMMLAKLCPWSIVYPTLVDLNAYEGQSSEELQRLLDCLLKLHPKLIQDVQLVINELSTITVFWEELWLSTLQDLRTDVIRRINMLKEEAARIAANSTLSEAEKIKINAAKYSAMMAPIVVALERRLASTSCEPTTVHEMWFQKEYVGQLRSAILGFKMPPQSAVALGDVWRPFDTLAASLAAHHRKSVIPLSEVAPQLASLSSSYVPMPGFEKQMSTLNSVGSSTTDTHGIVTISSFCEQLTILSTKTKPKKLVLRGSDGQNYAYLLKGREDLRLDARIMQLLQAINNITHSCHDTRSRSVAIRYYSVTPISGRAGLIQWVDKVTSIYSVYKSWQIRTQLAQASAVDAGNTNNLVAPVPRPSDMYYGKIIPALKEKGIRRVLSRRDWPLEVKRKVFLELMKETPRQLLWQEMWCASEGFRDFSLKAKRFSGSVAAMSIVGHILGLGDRHLDNILIDFYTGDIVHIDYNVCFDKGMRLKIPEIVPFRLTQIIEAALGLTGTEGVFRANCEAVMRLLKKNKDIILMLLEVFVWDPLVEWTRGESHDDAAIGGEEKKGMELAVSLSLFASRVQEIRVPLQEHHDLLVAALPAVEFALKAFFDVLNQYEVASAIFYHSEKERSSLMQQETSAKSIVAELTSISEKARAVFEVQAHEFAQAENVTIEKAKEAAMWMDQHGRVLDALRSGSVPDAQAYLNLSGTKDAFSLLSAVVVSGVPLTIVPEPTHAQCYDLDREISLLITELDNGLSSAIEALREYALALQRVLPLDYNSTSPVSGWAQVLQMSASNLSSDILLHARKQAAELIAKNQGEGLDSVQQRHQDLLQKMDHYAMQIEKVTNERLELMNSIGSDTEAKYRERLLSAFTNFVRSGGYTKNDDMFKSLSGPNRHDRMKDVAVQGDLEQKRMKVLSVLFMAVIELYKEVKAKVLNISSKFTLKSGWRRQDDCQQANSGTTLLEFEEQIERGALIASFVTEVKELLDLEFTSSSTTGDYMNVTSESSWASGFRASIHLSKQLIEEMTELVLPEIIKSAVTYNSEMMEAFGSLSQIRGSIDTTLEKLVEVELERASLMELEKNYFMNVGLITEKQLALGEAALNGRDHLSWEEAEELASEEEACRAQLNQLHQTWNQKDVRISSLTKLESTIVSSLISSQQYFTSMMNIEEGDLHARRSKALLASLAKPFSKLEALDQMLLSYDTISSDLDGPAFNLADLLASSSSLSESVWSFAYLLRNHAFFVWKISIMDNILDTCFHDISSSIGQNADVDQLFSSLKKKLENHIQEHICQYLNGKVSIAFLVQLVKENENLQHMIELRREILSEQINVDTGAVRRVRHMLEEYCNAHETAMAARSAISVMQRQISELTEALGRTILEIVQMEWLYDLSSPYLLKAKVLSQNIVCDDKYFPLILNLSRPKVLEKLQSSMSSITRSLECLQACERNSSLVAGQLERAMGWACAGPNIVGTSNSQTKTSGIPIEFHDHLLRRKQLLLAAQDQAAEITKICTSVMEFEASRDGLFWIPGEKSFGRTTADGRMWQQAYLSTLKRLDVSYHSFARAEQEWKLAEGNMEAAASGLYTATNELRVASLNAKSASDDLQDIIASMITRAYEASAALLAFSHVSKGHTALTSECGSMLEEVLAITEGLQDVYSLAKEASAAHSALMADLTEASRILLPLESSISTDLAAMADGSLTDREINKVASPLRGQALYQSYIHVLREACQSLVSLVPSLTYNVKELHLLLTKLARSSSLHAGNLHKALEGLGESQVVRSQGPAVSSSELSNSAGLFDNEEKVGYGGSVEIKEDVDTNGDFSPQEEGWISPPEETYTSSLESSITSNEASIFEKSDFVEQDDIAGEDNITTASYTVTDGLEAKFVEASESEHVKEESVISLFTALPPDLGESTQSLSLSSEAVDDNPDILNGIEGELKEAEDLRKDDNNFSLKSFNKLGANLRDPSSCLDSAVHIERGKNAYALSVLKQVELKIDGGGVEDISSSKVAEQVDRLLKQATSIDNLCNMYEGWTPWI